MKYLKDLLEQGKITQKDYDEIMKEAGAWITEDDFVKIIDRQIEKAMAEVKAQGQVQNKLIGKFTSGGRVDAAVAEKTINLLNGIMGYKAVNVMSEGVAEDGRNLVPEEFTAEVLRIIPEYGVARRDCRIIPMASKTKKIPRLIAGVTAYWVGEAVKKTTSKPNIGVVTLTAKKLAAIIPATDELLEDASVDTFMLIAQLTGEAFAYAEDAALFQGTESIKGLLTADGVNEVVTTGATFSTMTPDDLYDMITSIPSAARKGAKFYLNSTVLGYLAKKKDKQDNYVWMRPADGKPGTIWGYPYEEVDHALPGIDTENQADTPFVVFGNLQRAIIGDRKVLTIDKADQATLIDGGDTVSLWQQDMQAMRGVERIDIAVALPEAFARLRTAEAT